MEYKISELKERQANIVKEMLELLPQWFGIPEAIDEYAHDAQKLPTFGIYDKDFCAGLLVISYPSEATTEIHLIAVHPAYHRRGIGKHLIEFAESHAKSREGKFLIVKTLGAADPDVFYQATRQFYSAMGFSALIELAGIWETHMCLIMAKALA